MAIQLWSDNETEQDLLGFRIHADLIRSVVTDNQVLPVVLGVFGDWGGGKSSIMRMVQKDLSADEYEKTVCLYFNGWVFEGYEDAKTALLSSILIQLAEHKRFGPALKDGVTRLLKRVKWMDLAKFGIKHVVVPVGTALVTGGTTAAITAATVLGSVGHSDAADSKGDDKGKKHDDWTDLLDTSPDKPGLLQVRRFREEFADMLAKTDIESLVIIIDDLDRCVPERIIDTLEAIKLFVAVEKTAFVVGADPRIVRHAIANRYAKKQIGSDALSNEEEQYDLVKDYLEKLIQIPYHLPRLSPSEVESYVNLLACQQSLKPEEFAKVTEHWRDSRKKNMYGAYRHAEICTALGSDLVPELLKQLAWSNAIADVVTDGLKGNPRQVKRMLNAMALRKQLASVASIEIRDDVLAKLMVLEYTNLTLFQQLNQWQAASAGFPDKLKELESASKDPDGTTGPIEGAGKEWSTPTIQNWLRMQPNLTDIDLRDYFWLARDRTSSTLSGVTMVPPVVRRLFDSLMSGNKGQQQLAIRESVALSPSEIDGLLQILRRHVERHPEEGEALGVLLELTQQGVPQAADTFIAAVKGCVRNQLAPGSAFRLKTLTDVKGPHQQEARALLGELAKDQKSQIGKAAAQTLKSNQSK